MNNCKDGDSVGKKPDIKILIACHKPSELPDNDLFLPIRVGAEQAEDDFGLERDDNGKDNISSKNSGYCELTAIYWAWKNLNADYYGLFHYRRFYSFSDRRFPVSDDGHTMIRARLLSPEVYRKFGLTDESRMRHIIEASDLVVHESRPVKNLPTPMGLPGKSVREHYAYHDGTIVLDSDIEAMDKVIRDKYPDIYLYYQRYLSGDTFLGYNMFIMKKHFFKDMCQFEFGVLGEMERILRKDLNKRSYNANRIYGYLAEILTSAYIYYLRQTVPHLKVKELQMIYALKTDPISRYHLLPVEQSIPVVFDLASDLVANMDYYFQAVLQQFVSSCDSECNYDVIIIFRKPLPELFKQEYQKQIPKNISLRFLDYSNELDLLYETRGMDFIIPILTLPWLLDRYDKVIYLSWHSWVRDNLYDLFNIDLEEKMIGASRNMFALGQLAEVNCDRKISRAKLLSEKQGIDISRYYDTGVMLVNLTQIRKDYSPEDIISRYNGLYQEYADTEIINCLYNEAKLLGQEWNYQISTDDSVNYIGTFFAPISLYQEWSQLETSYKVGQFNTKSLVSRNDSRFKLELSNAMAKCSLWPLLLLTNYNNTSKEVRHLSLRDRIAPVGSRRRTLVKLLLPSGSRLRTMGGKLYRKIRPR